MGYTQNELDNSLFNDQQIEQIIGAFYDQLSKEQIKLLINPNFNAQQMWQIRYGFVCKLSLKEVGSYADPKNSASMMEVQRLRLISEKSLGVCFDREWDNALER